MGYGNTRDIQSSYVNRLMHEHVRYLKKRGFQEYLSLPKEEQSALDKRFKDWISDESPLFAVSFGPSYPPGIKEYFCGMTLLPEYERNFETWAQSRGYMVTKEGDSYHLRSFLLS